MKLKLIVFSSDHPSPEEASWLNKMFAEGLEFYHLKKKSLTRKEAKQFLENVEFQYHNRIVIHQHYSLAKKYSLAGIHVNRKLRKSGLNGWFQVFKFRLLYKGKLLFATCHRLESLKNHQNRYDYLIYSPLFKMGLSGKMEPTLNPKVTNSLSVFKEKFVLAMGGINAENIKDIREFGFKGLAVSSGIWNQDKNPIEAFLRLKNSL